MPAEQAPTTPFEVLRYCQSWFEQHSPTVPAVTGGVMEHPMLTSIKAALRVPVAPGGVTIDEATAAIAAFVGDAHDHTPLPERLGRAILAAFAVRARTSGSDLRPYVQHLPRECLRARAGVVAPCTCGLSKLLGET